MADSPGVHIATLTLPIYTRYNGVEMELGEATIEIPIRIDYTVAEDALASMTTTDTDPAPGGLVTGPHSRACGARPHNHGTACHSNCPTCGSDAPSLPAEGGVSLPVGQVGAPGDSLSVEVSGE